MRFNAVFCIIEHSAHFVDLLEAGKLAIGGQVKFVTNSGMFLEDIQGIIHRREEIG